MPARYVSVSHFFAYRFNKFAEKYLSRLEAFSARNRGKGWGAHTVSAEVDRVLSLCDGRPLTLAIDIGANKGEYSRELLLRFPDAKIVMFEPAAVNVARLTAEFTGTNTVIEPFAVSNEAGSAELYTDKPGSGLASLAPRRLDHFGIDFSGKEKVQLIRFEDYWVERLERGEIDFCKIDVEGHELKVLEGFGEAIHHTRIIQFEFGGCNIDTRTFFQDFWYYFKDKNFEIYRITPFGVSRIKSYKEELEFFSTTNFIAKRRSVSA